jgi:hypothetical protein
MVQRRYNVLSMISGVFLVWLAAIHLLLGVLNSAVRLIKDALRLGLRLKDEFFEKNLPFLIGHTRTIA